MSFFFFLGEEFPQNSLLASKMQLQVEVSPQQTQLGNEESRNYGAGL